MIFLFERGVFNQDYTDFLIAAGTIPVYRDPAHPVEHATVLRPDAPGLTRIWAHPSMPLAEIQAMASLQRWNER